jgi:flagellar export protein FliJ
VREFAFRYHALLKLRESRRDRCRQLLAGLLSDDRTLATRQTSVEKQRQLQLDELRDLAATGTVDVDRTIARRYYAARLTGEIQTLTRARALVARQLEQCRQALSKSDREVKVLEKLKEKQHAEFAYEENRREIRELGETWVAAHIEELSQ